MAPKNGPYSDHKPILSFPVCSVQTTITRQLRSQKGSTTTYRSVGLSAELKKELDKGYMVIVSGHVEWRETVATHRID